MSRGVRDDVEKFRAREKAQTRTVEEWQFLNGHGGWVDGNRNFPEASARDNAAYFKTYKVRSRKVTYTDWQES